MLLNTMATAEAAAAAMPSTRPVMEKALLNGIPPFFDPGGAGSAGRLWLVPVYHALAQNAPPSGEKGKKEAQGQALGLNIN